MEFIEYSLWEFKSFINNNDEEFAELWHKTTIERLKKAISILNSIYRLEEDFNETTYHNFKAAKAQYWAIHSAIIEAVEALDNDDETMWPYVLNLKGYIENYPSNIQDVISKIDSWFK